MLDRSAKARTRIAPCVVSSSVCPSPSGEPSRWFGARGRRASHSHAADSAANAVRQLARVNAQNSLPSGSARTMNGSSGSSLAQRRVAPIASIASAVAPSSFAAKSTCRRFLPALDSGTRWKAIRVPSSGERIETQSSWALRDLEPREPHPERGERTWIRAVDHQLIEADVDVGHGRAPPCVLDPTAGRPSRT